MHVQLVTLTGKFAASLLMVTKKWKNSKIHVEWIHKLEYIQIKNTIYITSENNYNHTSVSKLMKNYIIE